MFYFYFLYTRERERERERNEEKYTCVLAESITRISLLWQRDTYGFHKPTAALYSLCFRQKFSHFEPQINRERAAAPSRFSAGLVDITYTGPYVHRARLATTLNANRRAGCEGVVARWKIRRYRSRYTETPSASSSLFSRESSAFSFTRQRGWNPSLGGIRNNDAHPRRRPRRPRRRIAPKRGLLNCTRQRMERTPIGILK